VALQAGDQCVAVGARDRRLAGRTPPRALSAGAKGAG
jgi:hypothetical protein